MGFIRKLFGPRNLVVKHQPKPTGDAPLWKLTPVQPPELTTLTHGRTTILIDKVVDTIVDDFEKSPENWQIERGTYSSETTYYNYATTERRYTISRFQYNSDDKISVLAMNDESLSPPQQERIREAITRWHQKRNEQVKAQRRVDAVENLKTTFPNSVVQKESRP